jgi:hypothetical protein
LILNHPALHAWNRANASGRRCHRIGGGRRPVRWRHPQDHGRAGHHTGEVRRRCGIDQGWSRFDAIRPVHIEAAVAANGWLCKSTVSATHGQVASRIGHRKTRAVSAPSTICERCSAGTRRTAAARQQCHQSDKSAGGRARDHHSQSGPHARPYHWSDSRGGRSHGNHTSQRSRVSGVRRIITRPRIRTASPISAETIIPFMGADLAQYQPHARRRQADSNTQCARVFST